MNKYMEKCASLLVGLGLGHLAQNLLTRGALRNPSVGKSIATSFANGVAKSHEAGIKANITRGVRSAVAPDVEFLHTQANEIGHALSDHLAKMHPRTKAGLRMLSEGRVESFKKLEHRIPDSAAIHKALKVHPLTSDISTIGHRTGEVMRSKDHPLLSNIVARFGRAKPSEHLAAGHAPQAPGVIGSLAMTAAEPGVGALSSLKTLSQTNVVKQNPVGHKINKMVQDVFVKNPIKKGIHEAKNHIENNTILSKIKEVGYDYGVNSTSASLKRTSKALRSTATGD